MSTARNPPRFDIRVHSAAEITGHRAPTHANDQADQSRGDSDRQRHAPTLERAHEQIAPQRVGAKPVRTRQRRSLAPIGVEIDGVEIMR